MAIRKYVAQNRIMGLEPASRGADGNLVDHVVELGDVIELDEARAAPFVAGGSLKPYSLLSRDRPVAGERGASDSRVVRAADALGDDSSSLVQRHEEP